MNVPEPREHRVFAGVLAMALAVIFFTGIDTSAKWLSIVGIPVLQIVFIRYAGHFLISLVIYVPREGFGVFHSNAPKRQVLRSCALFMGTVLNFQALKFLPITVTTTISFAGPIVITLMAIPILGEKVGLRRIIAVCVGFLGVLLVIQPWGQSFHPAMLLSLCVLLMASTYFIMTRLLAGVETNATQQVWSSGISTIVLAPFALNVWVWPNNGVDWAVLGIIGFCGAMGHIAVTTAHRWADASILAPLIYTQVFWAALVGVVIFNTYPTVWTLAGAAVIITSGLYIWRRERYKKVQSNLVG